MRKFFLLIFTLSFFLFAESSIAPTNNKLPDISVSIEPVKPTFNITTAKIKEVEKLLGRKMKLKEKIGFKILQHKLRKATISKKENKEKDKGKTAMILGIIGLACLLIPFAALASIPLAILAIVFGNQAKKQDPKNGKAIAGVVLGWVTLGLILLALAIVVVILSAWDGWGWG